MDIQTARKKVQSDTKKNNNFMVIRFSYDKYLVLPYTDAITVLSALSSAELLEDDYSDTKRRIVPLQKDSITTSILSRHTYEQIKIANLLGISVTDLEVAEEQELNKEK